MRFLLGLYLVWLGLHSGAAGLATAVVVLVLAWVSDALDGPLARRDPSGRRTWIGDHDLEADLTVGAGVWSYQTLAGLIPTGIGVAYGAISVAALWHFDSTALAWGLQALPYASMIWNALRFVPTYGLLLLLHVVLVLVLTWPRFIRYSVPEFLRGMRDLLRAGDTSRHKHRDPH